jgi:hypothetical protein
MFAKVEKTVINSQRLMAMGITAISLALRRWSSCKFKVQRSRFKVGAEPQFKGQRLRFKFAL